MQPMPMAQDEIAPLDGGDGFGDFGSSNPSDDPFK